MAGYRVLVAGILVKIAVAIYMDQGHTRLAVGAA
jgi:hypothetical protein